ncbi:hypothetical protein [Actinoplanes regularis]|uniref:Uncharacterized protein n=1 Tax=Actinoplanes regularis TaxID=52697 RepID=A0A238V7H8_9ACTN|nr:hypothetical protein [Actinoplanes regularis]GIE83804.1 hypothetical protein Are01nite_02840 [Actinoplanes regularis]SNR30054.1 hypothetical protein SAMN06264365_101788 [Actinoplanes regularis]
MRINTMLMRPSLLPSAVCAPSALLPVAVAPSAPLAVERVLAPQAHQVFSQSQAELGKWAVEPVLTGGLLGGTGTNGTTGFKGSDSISVKRYTDGGGVPPRGRPV